ncbi:hypothetical protein [Microbacterium sp.]|uniref:PTS sugar transporter subunit IIB n=1 Tax=Microbacterium sp. TaxID=51671 RepID=UPI0026145CB3|nr:hypothetical protein [Microbacterium sp.]
MKILVVCGAGASSTFVAQRLRRAAVAAGLDWDASAGAESSVAATPADLVLVGPHLAHQIETIRAQAQTPVAALPADVFSDRDGTRTLAIVQATLSDSPSTAKGTS